MNLAFIISALPWLGIGIIMYLIGQIYTMCNELIAENKALFGKINYLTMQVREESELVKEHLLHRKPKQFQKQDPK